MGPRGTVAIEGRPTATGPVFPIAMLEHADEKSWSIVSTTCYRECRARRVDYLRCPAPVTEVEIQIQIHIHVRGGPRVGSACMTGRQSTRAGSRALTGTKNRPRLEHPHFSYTFDLAHLLQQLLCNPLSDKSHLAILGGLLSIPPASKH